MKKIIFALLATLSGVVLLFSYRTSLGDAVPLGGHDGGSSSTSTQTRAQAGTQGQAPTQSSSGGTTAGGLADGTYSGSTAQTRYGGVQVVVTVSGGSITSVDVPVVPDANRTDQSISAQAVPMLVDETMSAQSAQIHLISGATYTSQGYVQSLQSALDQASR